MGLPALRPNDLYRSHDSHLNKKWLLRIFVRNLDLILPAGCYLIKGLPDKYGVLNSFTVSMDMY